MRHDNKSLIVGLIAGVAVATPAAILATNAWYATATSPTHAPQPAAAPPAVKPASSPAAAFQRISYAQQGEDIAVHSVLHHLGIKRPTYLDIGAHDPIKYSNTYYFYQRKARGVLVEPNPAMADKLRRARPGDTVLNVGIGTGKEGKAPYYLIGGPGGSALNTFDKQTAESYAKKTKGHHFVEKVIEMPLISVNRVIAEHFKGQAPSFVSVDVEGLDLAILRSLDFERYRPAVICVETVEYGTQPVKQEILDFLRDKGYVVRGGSFVNTIFLDGHRIRR